MFIYMHKTKYSGDHEIFVKTIPGSFKKKQKKQSIIIIIVIIIRPGACTMKPD